MNYPIVKEIVDIKKENDYVKSIYFENDKEIKPGQIVPFQ